MQRTVDVLIWKPADEDRDRQPAIVDTGADRSVIRLDLAKAYGYDVGPLVHYWHMAGPATGYRMEISVRLADRPERTIVHEAWAQGIDPAYLREMRPEEECTRPDGAHFLGQKSILGMSSLRGLDQDTRRWLLGEGHA